MLKRGILTRKGIFSFLNLHITTSTAPISLLTRSMVWHMYSTMIHGCHASYTTRWMKTTQKRSWWTHPIVLRWRRMNAKNVEHVHLLREESTNRTWNGLSVFFASAANVKSRIECSTSQASEFVNEWMKTIINNYQIMISCHCGCFFHSSETVFVYVLPVHASQRTRIVQPKWRRRHCVKWLE
jgi:hypothetical protein